MVALGLAQRLKLVGNAVQTPKPFMDLKHAQREPNVL
jgi:hypothetical protein